MRESQISAKKNLIQTIYNRIESVLHEFAKALNPQCHTMISSARKRVNKQSAEYEFSEFAIHKDIG